MLKNLHIFMLTNLFEKFASTSFFLGTGPHCLLFFGEPEIDIPEE